MRLIGCLIAASALAGTVAGCQDPYYYQRNGYYQSYGYPQAYAYPSNYSYYPPPRYNYAYSQPTYGYRSEWDYYRNYNGIHPPGQNTYP
jgi:hypothetical protein